MLYFRPLLGAGFALAFVAPLAFTLPAQAADAAPAAAAVKADMKPAADPVEARIAKLHHQLKITSAQEDAFNGLAQVMRDNRAAHDQLVETKKQAEKTQTALDDLQAYALIAQSHADGVKKLATAFEALYTTLSDDQKKAADEAFREHKRNVMRRGMSQGMPQGMQHTPMNQAPMNQTPAQ